MIIFFFFFFYELVTIELNDMFSKMRKNSTVRYIMCEKRQCDVNRF